MKYLVYVGAGIKDPLDFINEVRDSDDSFLGDLTNLEPVNFYPLYSKASLFAGYKGIAAPNGMIPFVVIGHNPKSNFQLATNLSVLLVPYVENASSACCLMSEQFGCSELYFYKNTEITVKTKTVNYVTVNPETEVSFFHLVSKLKEVLSQNRKKLAAFFESFPFAFDLMPVHSFQRLPCAVANIDSEIIVKNHKWNSVATAFAAKEFSIMSTKDRFKDLGTLPSYFFEDHMLFEHYDEISIGVEK
ncbi:hypothetical protein [Pseudoalteromonas marina]|uniref:Uncharacterized protein n=2 Tax=Bacteria TaxID=2 RepID=A0ABT9FCB0_9GAMM|nr:hypothetical protein [Pseudoalteromonas marina]MDP2564405.1 hypothetical protein [Pseudoalteromonas marina]